MKEETKSVEYRIHGRVQGVGFRYFTLQSAQRHGVCGWVKNMPDGTVLARAQAREPALSAFKKDLAKGPAFGHVSHIDEQLLEQDVGLPDFRITH